MICVVFPVLFKKSYFWGLTLLQMHQKLVWRSLFPRLITTLVAVSRPPSLKTEPRFILYKNGSVFFLRIAKMNLQKHHSRDVFKNLGRVVRERVQIT